MIIKRKREVIRRRKSLTSSGMQLRSQRVGSEPTKMATKFQEFDQAREDFVSYTERLECYFTVNKVQETDRVNFFVTLMGAETYSLLKRLVAPKKPTQFTFVELVGKLSQHFDPAKNVVVERFKFGKRDQKPNESCADYAVDLRNLARTCEFGDFLDEALRDRFVCGLQNANVIQKTLLDVQGLTFDKACTLAQNMELTESNTRMITQIKPEVEHAHQVTRQTSRPIRQEKPSSSRRPATSHHKSSTDNQHSTGREMQCRRCGRPHDEQTCPVRNWKCFNCSQRGHVAALCRSKGNKGKRIHNTAVVQRDSTQQSSEFEEESERWGYCINHSSESILQTVSPLMVEVEVEGQPMMFEVDSGAARSIIPKKMYLRHFKHLACRKSDVKLRSVLGESLEIFGKLQVNVKCKSREHMLPLIVAESNAVPALLGRGWLEKLLPKWKESWNVQDHQVKVVSEEQKLNSYKVKFPNVFDKESNSKIRGFEAEIVMKPGVTPVFCKPYDIPYALVDKVKGELDRLVKVGTLVPVTASEWASPLVVVPKKNGALRLCVDFKMTLNRHIQTEHYPLPKAEDIFATLAGCTKFTVLDLANAYQQLAVPESAYQYLTVNSRWGLYRFTRLTYGISSAPALFQSIMDRILQGLDHVSCYLDDILIGGENAEDLAWNVERVLERLNEYNVRINADKCNWFADTVTYLGHQLDAKGIHPTLEKVEAIVNAPRPDNLKQLQAYLGLLNFYNRFLPNASGRLKPLHRLLEKEAEWSWSKEADQAFKLSKQLLVDNQFLVHFDLTKPIVVSCDASPYGVGAVLSLVIDNVERPVMFASATLNSAERNYSQLEREALAIIFAVRRFHKYVYGVPFTLLTDHAPLKTILGPKKGIPTLAAARLQRWAIVLSAYDYRLEYRKGTENAPADAMSRLPLSKKVIDDVNLLSLMSQPDLMLQLQTELFANKGTPLRAADVERESAYDVRLARVREYVKSGWPASLDNAELMPYFRRRTELSLEGNCLVWGSRIVIPAKLRDEVLQLLHDGHAGVVRMKMLARSFVWWPGLDQDIETKASHCESCQDSRPMAPKVPLVSWTVTERPWQRLHMDFGEKDGTKLLLLVDSHSKWIELWKMESTSASKVIDKLRSVIAQFGIPEVIVTDNGPPFGSVELKEYCKKMGIELKHSPPYHPNSNGAAEAAIKSMKRAIFRSGTSGQLSMQEKIDGYLFTQRNMPHSMTGRTPAEVMLRFQPRTKLAMLKPNWTRSWSRTLDKSVERVNKHRIKTNRSFQADQLVWVKNVRDTAGKAWVPGIISKVEGPVTYWVKTGDKELFAHADHIRIREELDIEDVVQPMPITTSQRPKRVIVKPRKFDC